MLGLVKQLSESSVHFRVSSGVERPVLVKQLTESSVHLRGSTQVERSVLVKQLTESFVEKNMAFHPTPGLAREQLF